MSIVRKRSSRPSPRRPRTVSLRPPSRIRTPNTARIANEINPLRASPPIHWAPSTTAPAKTQNAGKSHLLLHIAILMEHLLNGRLEVARERERERERGHVAPLLDRVDRLARDGHRRRQGALGQARRRPSLSHVVLHGVKLA